ncbi:MAG TPA: hypothetical protein PLD88_05930, partial [Candidatus Berkiella sp.]|nr:hypothetical protein [Candidatus Berkiella sp.]
KKSTPKKVVAKKKVSFAKKAKAMMSVQILTPAMKKKIETTLIELENVLKKLETKAIKKFS